MSRQVEIQVRRDTAANWTSINPTLASGEFGCETDTLKVKIGNGSTAWNGLGYIGTSAGVSSLDLITGAVSLVAGTNITITDNSPGAGQITIASSGGGGGSTDGWIDDTAEAWTYASGAGGGTATFTVSGDVRSKFGVGTRIKLTQSATVKYFVVILDPTFAAGTTTVTISAGTSYTLANSAISANFYSYSIDPQGYPDWFTFAGNAVGWSSITSSIFMFAIHGRILHFQIFINGTSNSSAASCTMPVASPTTIDNPGNGTNSGSGINSPIMCEIPFGSSTMNFYVNWVQASWSSSGTKVVNTFGSYRI